MIDEIINGASGLLGAGVNALVTNRQNRLNRQHDIDMYNRQLADNRANTEMANRYNEEMYNKYNSPLAQLRQMREAGLNPYLMYTGKGNVQGVQASAPSQGANITNSGQFAVGGAFERMAGSVQTALMFNLQKRQALSAIENTNASTVSTLQKVVSEKQDLIIKWNEEKRNQKLSEQQTRQIDANISKTYSDIFKIEEEIQTMAKSREKMDAEIGFGKREQARKDAQLKLDTEIRRAQVKIGQVSNEIAKQNANTSEGVAFHNNRLTEQKVRTEKALGQKLAGEISGAINNARLTEAQTLQVYSTINNLDAKTVNEYLKSGGTAVDLIKSIVK